MLQKLYIIRDIKTGRIKNFFQYGNGIGMDYWHVFYNSFEDARIHCLPGQRVESILLAKPLQLFSEKYEKIMVGN